MLQVISGQKENDDVKNLEGGDCVEEMGKRSVGVN